jgi:hypothetical protein
MRTNDTTWRSGQSQGVIEAQSRLSRFKIMLDFRPPSICELFIDLEDKFVIVRKNRFSILTRTDHAEGVVQSALKSVMSIRAGLFLSS